MRSNLTDAEWRTYKKVYRGIANVYFRNNDNDDWHNAFIDVLKDLRETNDDGGWVGIYNKLKQIKGDHV